MNSKNLSIILSIVVVILVTLLGYMVLKDSPETNSLSEQNSILDSNLIDDNINTTQPIINTEPAQVDETANWKTFRVSGYNGYEFKYPQTDILVDGIDLQDKILNVQGYWSDRGGSTEVAVLSSNSVFSVGRHGYIANLPDCKKVTWPNDQTVELTITKVINGITYYFGTYTGAAAGTQTRFNVYRTLGGSAGDGCFELVVYVSPLNGSTNISDQILSTFKFTK